MSGFPFGEDPIIICPIDFAERLHQRRVTLVVRTDLLRPEKAHERPLNN